jgi:hypothetical protein
MHDRERVIIKDLRRFSGDSLLLQPLLWTRAEKGLHGQGRTSIVRGIRTAMLEGGQSNNKQS